MSFLHQEVKYRGYEPVISFQPSSSHQRPGVIEASGCVKRLLAKPKIAANTVLSCSVDGGIQCVDTNFHPPKTLLSKSVFEIAHCGVDVAKPKMFTCIVGSRGSSDFFCYVFKCKTKEQAQKIVRGVAACCTAAFQAEKKKADEKKKQQQSPSSSSVRVTRTLSASRPRAVASPKQGDTHERIVNHQRASTRRRQSSSTRRGRPNPQLTDSWFRPSMVRKDVNAILRQGRVGDFIIRESQTRPGDYAISIQIGAPQVWTGLIIRINGGFQLGERGGITFDTLTELIAHFSQAKCMNDYNGYPLTLRLPDDTEYVEEVEDMRSMQRASLRRSMQRAPQASPQRRGPPPVEPSSDEEEEEEEDPFAAHEAVPQGPSFEDIMDGKVGMPDEYNVDFQPAPSNDDSIKEPLTEQEAFEMFMNQGGFDVDENGELVRIEDQVDEEEALENIAREVDSIHSQLQFTDSSVDVQVDFDTGVYDDPTTNGATGMGFDDDFVPDSNGPAQLPLQAPAVQQQQQQQQQIGSGDGFSGGFDDDFAPTEADLATSTPSGSKNLASPGVARTTTTTATATSATVTLTGDFAPVTTDDVSVGFDDDFDPRSEGADDATPITSTATAVSVTATATEATTTTTTMATTSALSSEHPAEASTENAALDDEALALQLMESMALEEEKNKKTIQKMAEDIFELVPPDEDDLIDGQAVRPVLLRSGLPVPVLGTVWMQVDSLHRGKLDFQQLCLVLGLMAQCQAGLAPDLETLDVASMEPPTIEDL